ncbi:undecaprenyl-diphosphate phosphatase [Nocardioides panacisoli]|uniref:Undecaprenyl-diphosphatase n=1 Tax=Nocardioides panacisoli TaxID=627624 RepID=A0ABP7IPH8_9ACTN
MNYIDSVVLGVVEGLTEFLPVSSTGHLTIAEKLLGLPIDSDSVTAFTAVIQMGAIFAVLVYFAKDIRDIAWGWLRGLAKPEYRGTLDHRMGWYVIVGSIPIGIVGFLAKDVITGPLRSLWWVAGALIAWSLVMVAAERMARQDRDLKQLRLRDALIIGVAQCIALVPGVSRSGATISVGLFTGLDRVAATKLSFYLSIPALLAAGLYELKDVVGSNIGVGETVVGTLVSFAVAYVAVAWLLKFVAGHSIVSFVPYRLVLGGALVVVLASGAMSAT